MSDIISRQAAIDICNYVIDLWHGQLGEGIVIAVRKRIEELPSAQPESKLISWLLDEIWDEDMWKLNWQAFPEILCRKLVKLGYVREKDGEYERSDKQERGD